MAGGAAPPQPSVSLFLSRSRELAVAARAAYALTPFDVLEVFDFGGAAFELLRSRRPRTAVDACDITEPGLPYLPASVPIVVRAHGSLQLIDLAEAADLRGGEDDEPTPSITLMYRMEQYALAAADAVFVLSPALAEYYTRLHAAASAARHARAAANTAHPRTFASRGGSGERQRGRHGRW